MKGALRIGALKYIKGELKLTQRTGMFDIRITGKNITPRLSDWMTKRRHEKLLIRLL
jgi:hypothetical protein